MLDLEAAPPAMAADTPAPRPSRWVDVLRLLRVKQWTKNTFVLAALIFTKGYTQAEPSLAAALAFLAMCLLSSGTYIVNDLLDLERDRRHPVKRNRPLAAGRIHLRVALILAILGLLSGLALAYAIRPEVAVCGLLYLGLQAAYNLRLKKTPVADVFVIATGFALRVVVGAVAIAAQLSGWILLCTGALALLLGFGKRRHEFHLQGENRAHSREALAGYTAQSLDMLVVMAAAGAAICYGVYSIESRTAAQYPALILTTPFVIYGICRYVVRILGDGDTGEPETLVLRDGHIVFSVLGFLATALLALSGLRLPFLD